MKSMLCEASSIVKAVEKAWSSSGKPREFTVTVLEQGEKNFLGFTKKPAIVSITYDPTRQGLRQRSGSQSKDLHNRRKSNHITARVDGGPSVARNQKNVVDHLQKSTPSDVVVQQQRGIDQQENVWTIEWAGLVSEWLKEITNAMGIYAVSTYKIDGRTLTILFDHAVLEHPEEERMLFISLSYLLIQFLKKKYKKKFRGFHLLIHSKARYNHDNQERAAGA